jgi:hypothetical protein
MSEKGIHERAIWNSKYKEGWIIGPIMNEVFPVSIELILSSRQIVESDQTPWKYPNTCEQKRRTCSRVDCWLVISKSTIVF